MAKTRFLEIGVLLSQLLVGEALAVDWGVQGKVTRIASPNFPDQVFFQLDTAAGACPANSWLVYTPAGSSEARQVASAQFVGALLLTAKQGGVKVAISGNNSGCQALFVDIISGA